MSQSLKEIGLPSRLFEGSEAEKDLFDKRVSEFAQSMYHKDKTYKRHGILSELLLRVPCYLVDHPQVSAEISTAATTGMHIFFNKQFYDRLIADEAIVNSRLSAAGLNIGDDKLPLLFSFVLAHELEHIRRIHLQRMEGFPADIANQAGDIRINIDIIKTLVGAAVLEGVYDGMLPPAPDIESRRELAIADPEFILKRMDELLAMFAGTAIGNGCAMKPGDPAKWRGMSSEEVAARLLMEYESAERVKLPFPLLCEALARDFETIAAGKLASLRQGHDALAAPLPAMLRRLAAVKGSLPPGDLQQIVSGLGVFGITAQGGNGPEFNELDAIHNTAVSGGKPPFTVGHQHIDEKMTPTERAVMVAQLINMLLNPGAGNSPSSRAPITVTDIDLPGSGKGKQDSLDSKPDSASSNDGHEMTPERMKELMEKHGMGDSAQKLGLGDLKTIDEQKGGMRDRVVEAIEASEEEQYQCGGISPGGHLTDYAKGQMKKFYKPRMSVKAAMRDLICGDGNRSIYDVTQPWGSFYNDPADMGLDSISDIPYLGSIVQGRHDKGFVAVIIDTSGSVSDNLLTRLVTEAINMADDSINPTAPSVAILFADTVVRGEPVIVTAENYQEYLANGITYGGRGGTNFTAAMEHMYSLFADGSGSELDGKSLDAMIYLTDGLDSPPTPLAVENAARQINRKPVPTLFLIPQEYTNDSFAESVSPYAETIFFNKDDLEIDLAQVADNHNQRMAA